MTVTWNRQEHGFYMLYFAEVKCNYSITSQEYVIFLYYVSLPITYLRIFNLEYLHILQ